MKDTGNKIARCLLMLAAISTPSLPAQQTSAAAQTKAVEPAPPLLQFDVASVKEFKRSGDTFMSSWRWDQSGLTVMNQTLHGLIAQAWGLRFYQISGGPDWMDSAYFQIQAKMDDSTAEKLGKLAPKQKDAMQQRMLQPVLTDRFKLTVRREMRPFPGYSVVVAKGGPKLHEASTGDDYSNGAKGFNGAPLGRGSMMMNWESGALRITAQAVAIDSLLLQLAESVQGKVQNETGLKGVYDINLRYAPDRGLSADPGASGSAPDAPPTIFDALQEQLGLKLEPHKVMDDALIVEHAEKPTEN